MKYAQLAAACFVLFHSGCIGAPIDAETADGPTDEASQAIYPDSTMSPLYKGYPISGLSGVAGATSTTYYFWQEMAYFDGDLMSFSLRGSSGDADLYVRRWDVPTIESYDCAPFNSGSNEDCLWNEDTDGIYYYTNVNAYESYSNAILHAYYSRVLPLGLATGQYDWNHRYCSDGWERWFYRVEVPAGKGKLTIKTTVDTAAENAYFKLYARRGDAPLIAHSEAGGNFTSVYDCKGTASGKNQLCSFTNPAAGTWYILLAADNTTSHCMIVEATVQDKKN
ncbi:PPC domain-containing protein [Sorangium sp. So ce1000]|uniref:PPC domain-containing protein n=1 Tax=Sorangium sp. So ce1000 TaxID=3133325 RepID=UPI003F5EAFC1